MFRSAGLQKVCGRQSCSATKCAYSSAPTAAPTALRADFRQRASTRFERRNVRIRAHTTNDQMVQSDDRTVVHQLGRVSIVERQSQLQFTIGCAPWQDAVRAGDLEFGSFSGRRRSYWRADGGAGWQCHQSNQRHVRSVCSCVDFTVLLGPSGIYHPRCWVHTRRVLPVIPSSRSPIRLAAVSLSPPLPLSPCLPVSVSVSHCLTHSLLITCTCCFDENKGTQDLKIYSHAEFLIRSIIFPRPSSMHYSL